MSLYFRSVAAREELKCSSPTRPREQPAAQPLSKLIKPAHECLTSSYFQFGLMQNKATQILSTLCGQTRSFPKVRSSGGYNLGFLPDQVSLYIIDALVRAPPEISPTGATWRRHGIIGGDLLRWESLKSEKESRKNRLYTHIHVRSAMTQTAPVRLPECSWLDLEALSDLVQRSHWCFRR